MPYLNSTVSIRSHFQRSVNIASDLKAATEILPGYQLQLSSLKVLQVISDYLDLTSQRAFTITGPYGSGKSSLGLFLGSLLGSDKEAKKIALTIIEKFPQSQSLKKILSQSPLDIKVITGRKGNIQQDINSVLFGDTLFSLKENLEAHPAGLQTPTLLIIDEMGRYLSGNQVENCSSLQEFAEYLNRGKKNIFFIGLLHQNLTSYALSRSKADKDEWAKVQGRFVDIPLTIQPEETLRILAHSINISKLPVEQTFFEAAVDLTTTYLANKKHIDKEAYKKSFKNSWPLNPVVSALLGPMSRRGFWQNNRSIFNFLTSQESSGFQDFLSNTEIGTDKLYSPNNLWDYLFINYDQLVGADENDGHKWVIAREAVERTEAKGTFDHINVAKTIGIISLFKSGSNLEATLPIICASLPHLSLSVVNQILEDLIKWKIVVERKHLGSYALFEGSDFDFEKALKEVKITEVNPLIINHFFQIPPLVARRYYAETGNLRWFSLDLVTKNTFNEVIKEVREGATGSFLLWIDESPLDCNKVKEITSNRVLVFGIPKNRKEIQEAALEVQQLDELSKDEHLEGDRTGRKEVELRLELAHSYLKSNIEKAFLQIEWHQMDGISKTTHGFKELSAFATELCRNKYPLVLPLQNELINRQAISSNIRAAQKRLLRAMLVNESEINLGIQGFPPEAMIYFSFFKANGLHIKALEEKYKFNIPQGSIQAKIWKETEKFLKKYQGVPIDQLYEFWDNAPFGIKNGIKPILLLFYYLTHLDSLTFYAEDVYQPSVTFELLELIIASPKDVKLKYQKIENSQQDLAKLLFEELKKFDNKLQTGDALSVSRSIVQIVLSLPKWTLRTSKASEISKKFREVILNAWDPINLLYQELPNLFTFKSADEITKGVIQCIKELKSLNEAMLLEVQEHFLKAIDAGTNLELLRNRANAIKGSSGQLQLEAFINRLTKYEGKHSDIEGLLGLASSKMVGQWTDLDILKAKTQISEWAFTFRHLEAINLLNNRKPGRRLFGLVLAGEKGQKSLIIDTPTELPSETLIVQKEIQSLLARIPREQAISVLIESGLDFIKERENGE